jgi:hypothetical protein
VGPSYTSTSQGQDSPAPDLERPIVGAFDTEPNAHTTNQQIAALAKAIVRHAEWQQRRIELHEARRKRKTEPETAA